MMSMHPTQTPAYWLAWASDERSKAAAERKSRHGTAESIRIHLANAAEYEARAAQLAEGQS